MGHFPPNFRNSKSLDFASVCVVLQFLTNFFLIKSLFFLCKGDTSFHESWMLWRHLPLMPHQGPILPNAILGYSKHLAAPTITYNGGINWAFVTYIFSLVMGRLPGLECLQNISFFCLFLALKLLLVPPNPVHCFSKIRPRILHCGQFSKSL